MSNYSAWSITPNEFPANASIDKKIGFLCGYGILAPSVHNVQPWRFDVSGSRLTVHLEPERVLDAGDPTGREGWLSIGACIENIFIAAQFFGLAGLEKVRTRSSVTYEFKLAKPDGQQGSLLEAMTKRRSNRNPYHVKPISTKVLGEISSINIKGVTVEATADPEVINLLADFTGRAIGIALGNPLFRHELSGLVHSSWTKSEIGMPAFTLGIRGPRSAFERRIVHSGMQISAQSKKEFLAMSRSGGIVLVFAEGDSQPYWISAGRAYQRAALISALHGLSNSTSAAVVEAADYHLDIEKMLESSGRLLTVMRIGYETQPSKHSPRLAIEKVLTFSS